MNLKPLIKNGKYIQNSTLFLLWFWMLLLLLSPYLIPEGYTGDLSGSVGIYDNKETIENMNPVAKIAYYLGDVNCHQICDRSYSYHNNQMPFCARDLGIFIGLALGFTLARGRKIRLTLPFILLALLPIGLDGTIQLLTSYESTNTKRILTGLIAGGVTGVALKIITESLERD